MKRALVLLFLLLFSLLPLACQQPETDVTPLAGETEQTEVEDAESAATEVAEPAGSFILYDSDTWGLSLRYPEGWITYTSFSGVTLASSPIAVEQESLSDLGEEAFATIIPGELAVYEMQLGEEFPDGDPTAVLDSYFALLQGQGESYVTLAAPATQQINDHQLATMLVGLQTGSNDTVMTILGVVINDEHMALISAGALQEAFAEYEPTLRAIVESVEVRPPVTRSE